MASHTPQYILSGDCGGTNTRLLLTLHTPSGLSSPLDRGTRVKQKEYRNSEYGSFNSIMSEFLYVEKPTNLQPNMCVLAAAGPVSGNEVMFTNSGWLISGPAITDKLGFECLIVNDFVGQGYGVLTLDKAVECRVLNPGAASDEPGPIVCVGAGTGLGECYLTCNTGKGEDYVCYPSEGGHAEFAPRTEQEFELLRWLKVKFSQKHRVSVERVVSGTGLANLYEFFATKVKPDDAVKGEFDAAGDMKGRVVSMGSGRCQVARTSMETFASAYGSECGVAALKYIPTGGLFVTGGLTPKNIEWIEGEQSAFMQAYRDKGRVSELVERVPMWAVMVEDLGLRGARWLGVKRLRESLARGEVGGGEARGGGTQGCWRREAWC